MVDAHNHLQNFGELEQVGTLLERAIACGVTRMVTNSAHLEDWRVLSRLATQHSRNIIPAFGIHPWYVEEASPKWSGEMANALLSHPHSIVGETGLDLYHNPKNIALQEVFFALHLETGYVFKRPVVIHCVRAWDKILEILESVSPDKLPPALLFHSYSGGKDLIDPLLKLGGWFSFAGTVLFEKNTRAREALPLVPRSRLLLETDAPDLPGPPEYLTGKVRDAKGKLRSEPADLRLILNGVSQLLGTSPEELERQLEFNLDQFLKPIHVEYHS